MLNLDAARMCSEISHHEGFEFEGKLRSVQGQLMTSTLPAAVGGRCEIRLPDGRTLAAEVIGFTDGAARLLAYDEVDELCPGLPVISKNQSWKVPVGPGLLGRVLDGLGRPVDDGASLCGCKLYRARTPTPAPLERARICEKFVTGQRVVDGILTLGRGQRVGIFAGSGVGKSHLLGEMAKNAEADVNVIALIGERGREVRPFLEDNLGPQGMAKSIVIVATCDQTPLMRVRASETAVSIADYFRRQGRHVLFMLDSLTRLAVAQREIGLNLNEPPSTRGFTPSVFKLLSNTVESLGNGVIGSVTGLLTVLVEGGDMDEPISDTVRSLVDGHIVLDRRLAERGHFPAVSIAQSLSRVTHDVTDLQHQEAVNKIRGAMAAYDDVEDLLRIGAYVKGSSPQVDRAVELQPAIQGFLKQGRNERSTFAETRDALVRLAAAWPF